MGKADAARMGVRKVTDKIEKALQAEWKMALYRNVLKDPAVERFLSLLKEMCRTIPAPSQTLSSYYDFAVAFLPVAAELETACGNAWQNYILRLILQDENLFSLQTESRDLAAIPEPIRHMARSDLNLLQELTAISNSQIRGLIRQRLGKAIDESDLPVWEGVGLAENRQKLKELEDVRDSLAANWGDSLDVLAAYYRRNGTGIFGRYHALRWVKDQNGEGRLVGVRHPDSIQLSKLYEYEREQAKIIENTEQFLAGYPANNVLLYGDRGTGKSSTVKALVNKYGNRGLRLIEVQKQDLEDYPLIIAQLAGRAQRFIIFIDDLSFTDDEREYRALKAMLEGSLEARPSNVLIYATSNRRHLVQERFSDKEVSGYDPDNEDVRIMDTMQEKLSLADRFGITVTFAAPDQKRFLSIVEKMVRDRGLDIDREELIQRALRWELNNNSRSGRTARQLVDYLEGLLALSAAKGRPH